MCKKTIVLTFFTAILGNLLLLLGFSCLVFFWDLTYQVIRLGFLFLYMLTGFYVGFGMGKAVAWRKSGLRCLSAGALGGLMFFVVWFVISWIVQAKEVREGVQLLSLFLLYLCCGTLGGVVGGKKRK